LAVERNTFSFAVVLALPAPALVCHEVITPPPRGTMKTFPSETDSVTRAVSGVQFVGSASGATWPTVVAAAAEPAGIAIRARANPMYRKTFLM
jgi:hypothetical protein